MGKRTLAVIMTNYNYAQYLETSIESVLSQTRLPDDWIAPEFIEKTIGVLDENPRKRLIC